MSLFVDTSVWSLALRRDAPPDVAEVRRLKDALSADEPVLSTGIVLQELLQGYTGARAVREIVQRFKRFPRSRRRWTITSELRVCAMSVGVTASKLRPSTRCSRSYALLASASCYRPTKTSRLSPSARRFGFGAIEVAVWISSARLWTNLQHSANRVTSAARTPFGSSSNLTRKFHQAACRTNRC